MITRIKICFLFLIIYFSLPYAFAEDNNVFPQNNGTCVNDFAKLINPEDTEKIKSMCDEIRKDELAVIVVATIDSIPKVKKEYESALAYGTDLFNYWKIGRKGVDDGILILVTKNDRKTAICTGYLTEHFLPDWQAGRILDKYMIPNFKKGDYGKGIIAGIIEARKIMEKNRKFMYPEKYGNN